MIMEEQTILDGVSADGQGNVILCEGFEDFILSIDTGSNADMTIQVVGSNTDTAPDFTAVQSESNRYSMLETIDLADGTSYDGTTGFVTAGTDIHKLLSINIEQIRWVSVLISNYVAGTVTAKLKLSNE